MTLVRIVGVPEAVAALAPARVAARLEPAFAELGREVATEASVLIGGHRLTGRAGESIHAQAQGGGLNSLRAQVESADPAVSALAFGWHGRGTQPPAGPIATWLERRGKDPDAAFVVARAIGRRGLSFAPLEMFTRAWLRVEPRIGQIVGRALGGR